MKALLAFFLLLLTLLAAALLAGPLLPWSAWKPGYLAHSTDRADVYYRAGTTLPGAYLQIERFVEEAEVFHHLPLQSRLTIVHTQDWWEFRRLVPPFWRSTGIDGVTLATGTVIYISPRAMEKQLDPAEFLRHELSHALLHQHQSFLSALRSGNLWLFEGLAILFGRQTSYRTEHDLRTFAKRHSLLLLIDPDLRGPDFDRSLAHSAWRSFTEFLMQRDRAAYQRFLVACMEDPRAWRDHFIEVYRTDFTSALTAFQQRLNAGFPPTGLEGSCNSDKRILLSEDVLPNAGVCPSGHDLAR